MTFFVGTICVDTTDWCDLTASGSSVEQRCVILCRLSAIDHRTSQIYWCLFWAQWWLDWLSSVSVVLSKNLTDVVAERPKAHNQICTLRTTEASSKLTYSHTYIKCWLHSTHSEFERSLPSVFLFQFRLASRQLAVREWVTQHTAVLGNLCVRPLKLMISTCASHSSAFLIIEPHL